MSNICEDCGFYMKAHPPQGGCPEKSPRRENTLIMGLPDHQQPSLRNRHLTPSETPTEFSEDVVVMVMPLAKAAHLLELAGMEDEASRIRSKAYKKGVV